MAIAAQQVVAEDDVERSTLGRVSRRILAFLFIVFVFNQLDRSNLSFAALQMNGRLGFDPAVYGFGVGMFFISYLLFEIPSNLILRKVGARVWLARIMITWGVIAAAMAFVYDETSFYVMRFLLGLAEAGFVPGYLYYLSRWVPEKNRAAAIALTAIAIPVAVVLGAPISGALLSIGAVAGLDGWQWMFIIEGLPSILLGFIALGYLTERPEDATWLTPLQRNWLVGQIELEQRRASTTGGHSSFGAAAADLRVWLIALGFFCATMSTYGIVYWMPQIIKQMSGLSNLTVSLLTALPFIGMGCGMYFNARHSDKTGERFWHFAIAIVISGLGLVISAAVPSPVIALAGLILCATGLGSGLGVLWPIPMSFLSGSAAAGGLALINMIGNSAGFFSPNIIGRIRQATGSFTIGLYVLAGLMLVSAILLLIVRGMTKGRTA
jgi:ACS family tartrate transporter-like MFS transporter